MRDSLLQLLELQEIDKELHTLQAARESYPAEISSRRGEIERARQALEACSQSLAQLGAEQRRLERELEAAKQHLKAHEARFAQVTTNREYDALQVEIDACRTRIAEYEAQIVEVIGRSEAAQQTVTEEQSRCAEISSEHEKHIKELEEKLASLEQEVDRAAARRRFCAERLDAKVLRTYDRIRKKPGTRVAPVRKGACSGCYRRLPPQHLAIVRRNDRAYFCESCGALLVWDADSA